MYGKRVKTDTQDIPFIISNNHNLDVLFTATILYHPLIFLPIKAMDYEVWGQLYVIYEIEFGSFVNNVPFSM